MKIKQALEKLPDHHRVILMLYHMEEMKYSEIGQILDLPEGTVKSYLFRARNYLREELLKTYQQEDLWQ